MPFGGLLTGALISGGSSLLSGILGSNAAGKAAALQQKAATQGIAALTDSEQQVLKMYQETGQAASQNYSPYTAGGGNAENQLSSLLQPGGQLTQQFGSFDQNGRFIPPAGAPGTTAPGAGQITAPTIGQFTPPDGVTEQNDPGYQARLQAGIKAVQNASSKNGDVLGSAGIKGLDQSVQDYASNEYSNVFNRAASTYGTNAGTTQANFNNSASANQANFGNASTQFNNTQNAYNNAFGNALTANQANFQNPLNAYNANFNTFNANNTNLYNRLFGLSNQGLTASSGLTGTQAGLAGAAGSTQTGTASSIANILTGAGNAGANGVAQGTNAITGAIGNIGNTASQTAMLQALLKSLNP